MSSTDVTNPTSRYSRRRLREIERQVRRFEELIPHLLHEWGCEVPWGTDATDADLAALTGLSEAIVRHALTRDGAQYRRTSGNLIVGDALAEELLDQRIELERAGLT